MTCVEQVDRLSAAALETAFSRLKTQGQAVLEREGLKPDDRTFLRQIDMRYVGQSYELTIPLSDKPLSQQGVANLMNRFYQEHDRAYGFSAPNEPVELVNLRATAIGKKPYLGCANWTLGTMICSLPRKLFGPFTLPTGMAMSIVPFMIATNWSLDN